MKKLNDEQSQNSQFGDNINNPNQVNIRNKKSINGEDFSSDSGMNESKKLKDENQNNINLHKKISRNPLIG